MLTETDLRLPDGRTLHVYDTAPDAGPDRLVVVWHHGTPNTGPPPEPLLPAGRTHGVRWIGYDRPGYGGSSPHTGRDVAAAARDVAAIADSLGIAELAVMGHSGGATHALASAALSPDRVLAAVAVSGLAPYDAPGLDWYAGMGPAGAAELRAASHGASALHSVLASSPWDPEQFTPADHAALAGPWSWLNGIAALGAQSGLGPMVDDDLAYVSPWGFDPMQVTVPVLLVHGEVDRVAPSAHARWLADRMPTAELWLSPGDGHISVLREGERALDWLVRHAGGR